MTVDELIKRLRQLPGDAEVMIRDNGDFLRSIKRELSSQIIEQADADECADCEGLVAETVFILNFRCY